MPPELTLRPLTDDEYADFATRQVGEYTRQNVCSGDWTRDEAAAQAREAQADLLTDRLRGTGLHFLAGIAAEGRVLGWLSQITVDESVRGKRVVRALLEQLHAWLRTKAVDDLWLRVFDWNTVARRLCTSLGYEVVRQFATDSHMRKHLGGSAHVSPHDPGAPR